MTRIKFLILFVVPFQLFAGWQITNSKSLYLTGVAYTLEMETTTDADSVAQIKLVHKDQERTIGLSLVAGKWQSAEFTIEQRGRWQVSTPDGKEIGELRVIPGWVSVLPPLVAIFLALISRQVLVALFAGIWMGAFFIFDYRIFWGFFQALTEYIGKAPISSDRMSILIFSLTLGGMVGVMSRSGGTRGIVEKLAPFASSTRRGQLVTWLMGVLIFFDDYANTLIVGNTMRPMTDKLHISREKLAYLVDSTAAPVANIAIISTWIGYELSLISAAFVVIGISDNAYITFFKTIPYNFYPLFSLAFGLFVALTGRDLFSMYRAEKRAAEQKAVLRKGAMPLADMNSGELECKQGVPLRWYNALLPVAVVILTTLIGLWVTGLSAYQAPSGIGWLEYASGVVGQADSFAVLMWAAFLGSFAAIILAVGQRILNLNEAIMAWVSGVKAMVLAGIILTLAWAIGNICTDLQTAEFVIAHTRSFLSPHLLPLISFFISGIIAFATGTSWGTMAILAPIVIPLAHHLPLQDAALPAVQAQEIFLSSIASILAGATFGDHCSPISDTTIMSSMASGADHIDHVRTQLPYALLSAGIAILFGYLPVGFGLSDWYVLPMGLVVTFLVVRFGGKKVRLS